MEFDQKSTMDSLKELIKLHYERKCAWQQQLLLATSTLFGVLIALQKETSSILIIRLIFAISLVFMAIGILSLSITLYSQIDAIKRLRKKASEQAVEAYNNNEQMQPILIYEKKVFKAFEICFYISIVSSVLLLSIYVLLKAIFPT